MAVAAGIFPAAMFVFLIFPLFLFGSRQLSIGGVIYPHDRNDGWIFVDPIDNPMGLMDALPQGFPPDFRFGNQGETVGEGAERSDFTLDLPYPCARRIGRIPCDVAGRLKEVSFCLGA